MARKMITLRLAPELTESLKEEAENNSITLTEHVTRLIHQGRDKSLPNWPEITEQISKLERQYEQTQLRCEETAKSTLNVKEKLETVADELLNFKATTQANLQNLKDRNSKDKEEINSANNLAHHLEGQITALHSIVNSLLTMRTPVA